MSEEKAKAQRLFKVAKELNVGSQTLVKFLNDKGFPDVQNLPNEKLSDDMYELLIKEYASQRALKEKSEQIKEHNKEQRDALRKPAVPEEEPIRITAEDLKVEFSRDKESANLPVTAPVPLEPEVKPVQAVAPDPLPPPVIEETKIVIPEVTEEVIQTPDHKQSEPLIEEEKPATMGLKVIGKIDLGSKRSADKSTKKEGTKTQGGAKKKTPETAPSPPPVQEIQPVAETPAETLPEAIPVLETIVPAIEQPVLAETLDTSIALESEIDDSVIRAKDNTPKLSGLKVMGKIELPVNKPPADKKDGAGGNSNNDTEIGPDGKRRRKRKRKTGIVVPPATGTGNTSGPNTQTRKPVQGGNSGVRSTDSRPKAEPTEKEIQEKIRNTLANLNQGASRFRQKLRRGKRDVAALRRENEEIRRQESSRILEVTEFLSANELANLMTVPVNQVIAKCMELGFFVSINQRIEADVISLIADEFGFTVKFVQVDESREEEDEVEDPDTLIHRAPIVTVMGHVDHGKTSLLDYVRKANVIAGEAGGITQHIGAYEVTLENDKKITFLDTPGHEAFTAMRARGAQITDIVIIVVAADDEVMPQTKEAINHAQAAGVPMIFAINKVDKEGANPERVREQLSQMNILVEDWGGKYQCQEISAKFGQGIDLLLEKVLLEAELLELTANPDRLSKGTVIEAQLDKGRGIVTTLLVQTGTLKVGDVIVAGQHYGKVKAMMDERGKRIQSASPSTPVQLLGLSGAPQAGDKFQVYETEREARELATRRQQLMREQSIRQQKHITLDEIARRKAIGNFKELNLIVKGDVDGSVEALSDSLIKLSNEEVKVNIILKSVGQISESDVLLASASDAIIIGFQVRPSSGARKLAEQEEIDIRLYSIIYDAINEIKDALEGLLAPEIQEEIVATVEIRDVFKISKVGTIAGCYVTNGKITRNTPIRLIRDGIVIFTGKLQSLKRFKDDVKEVASGFECGLAVDNYSDIQVGDIVEGYEQKEVKRKLS